MCQEVKVELDLYTRLRLRACDFENKTGSCRVQNFRLFLLLLHLLPNQNLLQVNRGANRRKVSQKSRNKTC